LEEVFGPILPILTYRSLDEAFGKIAATPHPLAAFVFSRDQKTIDRFIGELSYGGGAVNQTNIHLYPAVAPGCAYFSKSGGAPRSPTAAFHRFQRLNASASSPARTG
jgi:acyl-CoA reductase-like NAD-dependent aldehyde dehydrogenase